MATLRSWLRRSPQPSYLVITTEDDEEKKIKLSDDSRNRWKSAEEAVRVSRAVSVACMSEKGEVLRATQIDGESGGDDATDIADEETRQERKASKEVSKERRELAALLDRYGDRLCEAFDRGADATARSQESLVSLVETLSAHLSTAITQLHALSFQYAQVIQQGSNEPDGADKMLAQLAPLAMAMAQRNNSAPPNGKKEG